MPQKFEQMQSAEQKHDEDETIAQAGTQIDDTVDALDAVLDDIESVSYTHLTQPTILLV